MVQTASFEASYEGIIGKINIQVLKNPVEKIVLTSTNSECRTGDVVQYSAIAYDKKGQKINENFPFKYSVYFIYNFYCMSSP